MVEPEGGSDAPSAAPALEEGGPSTSYLLFIDDYFSKRIDRNKVLDGLATELDFLGPRDRMAVVAYDGRRLEVLSTWTHQHRAIEVALRQAKGRPADGLKRLGEQRRFDEDRAYFRDNSAVLDDLLTPVARDYAMKVGEQVGRAVGAAAATLRSFATPPGRRVMLVLAGGWPISPVAHSLASYKGIADATFRAAGTHGIPGHLNLLGPLIDTANLLGYTLYPVDVPGVTPVTSVDAAKSRFVLGGGPIQQREEGTEDSLRLVADQTGGRALINKERLGALETVAGDIRSFYWLGFTLDRKADGSRHTVEVEVLRPGVVVRQRAGFVDLSRREEVTMMVESSLLFGTPPSTRPLEVRFGDTGKPHKGVVAIPLSVGFPLDEITMVPFQDSFAGKVEVVVRIIDEKGSPPQSSVDTVEIVGEAAEAGELFWWSTELLLRRGRHELVIAVHDPLSDKTFSSTVEISP